MALLCSAYSGEALELASAHWEIAIFKARCARQELPGPTSDVISDEEMCSLDLKTFYTEMFLNSVL